MSRIVAVVKWALQTFGALFVYWTVFITSGVKPAIAVGLLFVVAGGGWRLWTRRPLSPLWLIANGAVLLFGTIDLWARTPFMIRYEGPIFNLGIAIALAVGAFGEEPILLQLARGGASGSPERSEVIRFFRAFTIAWSMYFVLRALVVLWIMARYPLREALVARAAFAWISMCVMLIVSISTGPLFMLCQCMGFFRAVGEQPK